MSIESKRWEVRTLLHEKSAADASAAYYALYHPADKTDIHALNDTAGNIQGYVCLSRTGMDLFRPLLTMRLPPGMETGPIDPGMSATLLNSAIPPGTPLILNVPQAYRPIISALFDIQREVPLRLMVLDREQFEPIINVLITESESYNNLPRFVVRTGSGSGGGGGLEVAAAAGVNWQSPYFAEIYVHTKPAYRRRGFGRSVVAAIVQKMLAGGRTPLYSVAVDNKPSAQLAESVGFVDTGLVDYLIEATFKPHLD